MRRQSVTFDFTATYVGLVLFLLLQAFSLVDPQRVLAHIDPPGCRVPGISIVLQAFRADRQTPLDLSDRVTECETICFRMIVSRPASPESCAFENGVLEITTPGGLHHGR